MTNISFRRAHLGRKCMQLGRVAGQGEGELRQAVVVAPAFQSIGDIVLPRLLPYSLI